MSIHHYQLCGYSYHCAVHGWVNTTNFLTYSSLQPCLLNNPDESISNIFKVLFTGPVKITHWHNITSWVCCVPDHSVNDVHRIVQTDVITRWKLYCSILPLVISKLYLYYILTCNVLETACAAAMAIALLPAPTWPKLYDNAGYGLLIAKFYCTTSSPVTC